jgi:pilus assembly protein CpaE
MTQPLIEPIQIVIADADPVELSRTRALLMRDSGMQVAGSTSERNDVLRLLDSEPSILLLTTNIETHDISALIRQALETSPRTQVLLVVEDTATVDLRRAMLAGARGILQHPLHPLELLNTIHEIINTQATRRQRFDEIAQQRKVKASRGKIITVFSPKGGVGCTLLAASLAVSLRSTTGKRVALVDYSLQFGTIGTMLNVLSIHTLAELVPHYQHIDSTILSDVLVPHSSGVQVLLPPASLEQVDMVTTESLVSILEGIRAEFDYVVVDLWHAIEDATLTIMEMSDTLLVVTTPEVPALYTMRRFLDVLKQYPDTRHRTRLVVNRHPSRGGVELNEIEQSLGLKVLTTVPSDGQLITQAINEGITVQQKQAGSVAVRQLNYLAAQLAGKDVLAATAVVASVPPARTGRGLSALWNRTGA